MPSCPKQISTENGVLTCDKNQGHPGMHHAKHKGGDIRDPYERKTTSPTDYQDDRGNYILTVRVGPLEIEWPQEGMTEAVKIKR